MTTPNSTEFAWMSTEEVLQHAHFKRGASALERDLALRLSAAMGMIEALTEELTDTSTQLHRLQRTLRPSAKPPEETADDT